MIPTTFPEANVRFGPPDGMEESQVMSIPAHVCEAKSGSCDGVQMVVVAWLPSAEELRDMQQGKPVYLSMIGGLAPHFLTTDFKQATNPA